MRRLRTSNKHQEHALRRGAGPVYSQRGRLWQIFLCSPILFIAAGWRGEGGCRPISQLEGAALATAIGSEISLLQSGSSSQQPQQVVIFRPQVFSQALSPALAALRLPCQGTGPIVLIERPLQGCTVVATEQVPSPSGAETGDREDGEATGADEAENIATGGEATSPVPPGQHHTCHGQ